MENQYKTKSTRTDGSSHQTLHERIQEIVELEAQNYPYYTNASPEMWGHIAIQEAMDARDDIEQVSAIIEHAKRNLERGGV